jgi:hypothetical protein
MSGQANMLMLLMTAALLSPAQVAAQDCAAAVRTFEHENRLSGAAPTLTQPEGGTLTDTLAQSGGVVRPPDIGSGVVLAPPRTGDGMETAPAPARRGASTEPPHAEAGRQAQAEALLQSAREATRQGDDAACQTRLQEAQSLLERRGEPR